MTGTYGDSPGRGYTALVTVVLLTTLVTLPALKWNLILRTRRRPRKSAESLA